MRTHSEATRDSNGSHGLPLLILTRQKDKFILRGHTRVAESLHVQLFFIVLIIS